MPRIVVYSFRRQPLHITHCVVGNVHTFETTVGVGMVAQERAWRARSEAAALCTGIKQTL